MMMRRRWMVSVSALAVAMVMGSGCAEESDQEIPPLDIEEEVDDQFGGECYMQFQLPDADSYALTVTEMVEPSSVADIAGPFMDDIPSVLLFAEGLTDGTADSLNLLGGVGERTGYGYDDTPGTEEDVYSMYDGSFDTDACDFQARLVGQSVEYEITAATEEFSIDLGEFSSLTEGISLRVSDVELTGVFDEQLDAIDDVTLAGMVRDEGLDELLDAFEDRLPLSREDALDLIEPDEDGNIPVELQLEGRSVVIDGFMPARDDRDPQPRADLDVGECCPDGLDVGDSILDHLNWQQQGLSSAGQHEQLYQKALPYLRDDEKIAMVVTAEQQSDGSVHYKVWSGGAVEEGYVIFERHPGDGMAAPEFEIVDQGGVNPLEHTDPRALAAYEEFLETGVNPNDVSYLDQGYSSTDSRVGFVPPEQMHYPFAMERIAQNFDDPRAGDFMLVPASWSTGGFSTHGNLGSLQSRAPLVMMGPGIRSAADVDGDDALYNVDELGDGDETLLIDEAVRQVDIAPTVAAALGVEQTTGVGPDLRISDEVYLRWQDGRVLEEVFTDDAIDAIEQGEPVAERAVVIINDGLTNTELLFQVLSEEDDFGVDFYREMFRSGLAFEYGSISNFPSNTFPGHNTVGSGVWAGHHGVVDNRFWDREEAVAGTPIGDLFETEELFGSAHQNLPVETLYEAVERSFGTLDDGVFTASINEPSTRGADFASLEYREEPGGFELSSDSDEIQVGDQTFEMPPATVDDYTGVMDNISMQMITELFQDHVERGEDEGLPIPAFTYMNMASTDTYGHQYGPHGDFERYDVISATNERMMPLLEMFEKLEIDDSTLVVLTADHGMELQDTSRSSSRGAALNEAGVQARREGFFYYFKDLGVLVDDVEDDGSEIVYSLQIVDRATKDSEEPFGIEGVDITAVDGGSMPGERTDEDGHVELTVQPDGDSGVLLEFDHPEWNAHRERIGF